MVNAQLVKPPQSRRGVGVSTVHIDAGKNWGSDHRRVFVKSQRDYTCRPLWRALRRTPTLAREYRALLVCHDLGLDVPEVVDFCRQGTVARLVLAEIVDSNPLDEALAELPAARRSIIAEVGRTIARLHNAGWYHGALLPEHVLVSSPFTGRISLIDFEKARFNPLRAEQDLNRLFRRASFLGSEDVTIFGAAYRGARLPALRWSGWRVC